MFTNMALTKLNQLVSKSDFDKFLHVGKDDDVIAVLKFKNDKVCLINQFGAVTWEGEDNE